MEDYSYTLDTRVIGFNAANRVRCCMVLDHMPGLHRVGRSGRDKPPTDRIVGPYRITLVELPCPMKGKVPVWILTDPEMQINLALELIEAGGQVVDSTTYGRPSANQQTAPA
jgi:hypothetical protein